MMAKTNRLAGTGRQEAESIPLKRFGTSKEVASTIVYLASEDASFITGATLNVNGGLFMG